MRVELVPLLAIQRDLYGMPRGAARFDAYISAMLSEDRTEPRLPPLVAINPMAKEAVARLVEDLITIDAERLAADAAASAAEAYHAEPGEFRMGLVVVDDAGGGWTSRVASEFAWAAWSPAAMRPGWLVAAVWSSEPVSAAAVRESAAVTVHRAAYARRHGVPRTLAEFMAQEGFALAGAGCSGPSLEPDDMSYTREVLAPLRAETDPRAIMECLYGDDLCRPLGFTPRGLTPRAGLALSLADARDPCLIEPRG